MSDAELRSALAVASGLNTLAVVIGVLINDAKLRELRAHVEALFDHLDQPFDEMRDPPRPT
jgi:hypothetical protein